MKNDILYQTEYGHVRFGRDFRGLLKSCVGQKTSRYAINSIQVTKDGFVATNGQCLVVYICEHTVRPGLYHLTTEGYGLFNDTTDKFPKWQDIVPKPSKIKEVYRVSSVYEDHIRQNFIFHLHSEFIFLHAGMYGRLGKGRRKNRKGTTMKRLNVLLIMFLLLLIGCVKPVQRRPLGRYDHLRNIPPFLMPAAFDAIMAQEAADRAHQMRMAEIREMKK